MAQVIYYPDWDKLNFPSLVIDTFLLVKNLAITSSNDTIIDGICWRISDKSGNGKTWNFHKIIMKFKTQLIFFKCSKSFGLSKNSQYRWYQVFFAQFRMKYFIFNVRSFINLAYSFRDPQSNLSNCRLLFFICCQFYRLDQF